MNSDEIRQKFLDFFQTRDHLRVPSASLVPNDPDVVTLFTIAGMQQIIPYFLGKKQPPSRRLVSDQKCLRMDDLDDVGDDTHMTFFEMLGNFSVGDYFKREAIAYTYEFITEVMGIPKERCWAVTFTGDTEARDAWLAVGIPPERVGETDDNWWQPGPVGPQGPNSEIHFDRGQQYGCGGPNCRPETECCDRFVELWNDVFIQYNRDEAGELRNLPWKNVDTGMGFERLTMVVQGVESIYDTDSFQSIIRSVAGLSGVEYKSSERLDRSLRIIADHCRAAAFVIADGVMPSSEGRGYVLRRLIRRAALHGRLLGIDRPFLTEPVARVIEGLGGYWTELSGRQGHILQVVEAEERRFLETLARGLGLFEDVAARAIQDGKVISGRDAFVLYDTHGFPLELTSELAQERGLSVDQEGFERALREQQERARAGRKYTSRVLTPAETYSSLAERIQPTVFTGYEELSTASELLAIIAEGKIVPRAAAGDEVELVLAATPFYAESGGQVGDTGFIRGDAGTARVTDTQRPVASIIVHRAEVINGTLVAGDVVEAEVDTERRLHILPHHSATHLMHKALQEVLGPEATQAGSLVAPDRLRFDFRWPRPLTDDELREIEDRVNAAIWANLRVRKQLMPYDEAIRSGAMALFGEKYGDVVRVVSMGDWSKELCGGTHVNSTGDIGLFVITAESGIGSGVRRIEALAGAAAYGYVNRLRQELAAVAEALDTPPGDAAERARSLVAELRESQKRSDALTRRLAEREAEALLRDGIPIDAFTVVADEIAADSVDYLRATSDALKAKLERGIIVLGSVVNGKPAFTMAVTRDLSNEGFAANQILKEAARQARAGGAGGSPEFATGGGGDVSRLNQVLQTAVQLIREKAGAP